MNDFLTIPAAADVLSVSENTVRRRIKDGTIKFVRVGPRLIRIPRASIEALLEQANAA